jgi:sarcosine oxidase subunit beta
LLPKIADVVVIGGGVIGTSVTYYLAKKGVKVLLLEKEGIAAGTSSAGEGVIFLQLKKPGIHLKLALESAKNFKSLEEELDFEIGYRKNGTMLIVQNEKEVEVMKIVAKELRKTGLNVAFLDKKQAREKEPALSEKIFGATFSSEDAQVNPMYLSLGLTKAAISFGAKIFTHTKVIGINVHQLKKIKSVKTTRGVIFTNVVVNAAGIYASEIGKMINLDIPITPRRGQLLVTEVVPQILSRPVTAARYLAIKYNPEIAKIEGKAAAIEPTENGNLLIGSTREFVGFDKSTTYEGISDIAESAITIVPKLENINIIRTFAGLRPYTVDGLPILGKVDNLEGFIMAAGHEGDGIALAPITGELIAELITTSKTRIELSEFNLKRFY